MIRVHVTLKGSLAGRLPGGSGAVEVPEPATAASLAAVLGLPHRACVVVVNGQAVRPDVALAEGDRVQFFPQMAGGGPLRGARTTR